MRFITYLYVVYVGLPRNSNSALEHIIVFIIRV